MSEARLEFDGSYPLMHDPGVLAGKTRPTRTQQRCSLK